MSLLAIIQREAKMQKRLHFYLLLLVAVTLYLVHPASITANIAVPAGTITYFPLIVQSPLLQLSDLKRYGTTQYSYAVLGEVINLSSTQAFSVTLEAQIYDSVSGTIITKTLEPEFAAILPSQSNPFAVHLVNEDGFQQLSIRTAVPITTTSYQTLTVIPQSIKCGSGFYGTFQGVVRNDTDWPIHAIRVRVWGLNDDVNRGLDAADITGTLRPHEEVPFFTSGMSICYYGMLEPGVMLEKFHFAAQGVVGP